jgi:carbon storage regulator
VLVLTRKPGESIRIGDDISIVVIEIQRGQVKLAIDAPRDIPVHREEIYELVQDENVKAARHVAESNPAELWRRSRRDEQKGGK